MNKKEIFWNLIKPGLFARVLFSRYKTGFPMIKGLINTHYQRIYESVNSCQEFRYSMIFLDFSYFSHWSGAFSWSSKQNHINLFAKLKSNFHVWTAETKWFWPKHISTNLQYKCWWFVSQEHDRLIWNFRPSCTW